MDTRTTIDITVSAFIDGLTTRQKGYQNAILNGKDIAKSKQELEQLIAAVDFYLETVHILFSKDGPLESLRRTKSQAMHTLINN